MQAPPGVSIDYTHTYQRKIEAILKQQPEVQDVFDAAGFSFTGNGSNYATMFIRLRPWSERKGAEHRIDAVLQRINMRLYFTPGIQAFALNPPSIPGLGFQGGFDYQLEDRGAAGIPALLGAAYQIIGPANAPGSGLFRVYTTFRNDKPTVLVDVNRPHALSLGVPLTDLFTTMQVYLGSVYVNDFDMNGKAYRVYVQADSPYRSHLSDLNTIYVRSSTPQVVNGVSQPSPAMPIASLLNLRQVQGPQNITHFNLYRSIDISGGAAPGHGTGEAITTMQTLASHLPPGFVGEWSGISREQQESGSQAAMIFGLGILFVFLVLAAQYESFADPLIILFAVPLGLLGAIGYLGIRHITTDVFAQVGFVMLIGLASKNAILIVEFANQLREQGLDAVTAVRRAAETRLRPILMTSIAFVLGVTPLVFATGAGSASRNSLGTAVFGGMIVSTILNLFITPVLYVLVANLEDRLGFGRGKHHVHAPAGDGLATPTPETATV
jgi:HAE1 family hydrophobic/amphiphilic exporter-1